MDGECQKIVDYNMRMLKGKIINVNGSNLLISDGYLLRDDKGCYKLRDMKYGFLSHFKLTRRLFRAEITGFYTLSDGTQLVLAKKGIFRRRNNEKDFFKICGIPRGSKPLNLCITPSGNIYFGEYFQNVENLPIHIYKLNVENGSLERVYTFEKGEINHIHGVFFDQYTNRIWVVTGDAEHECIIGYTEDEFKTFVEVLRGGQEYRCCQMFFYRDFIVYCTDSEFIENSVKCIDRKTKAIKVLLNVTGSVIKGGQNGDVSYFSTNIEPSQVNTDKYAHLWISKDGINWEDRYSAQKDSLPAIFQFGSFEFPHYESPIGNRFYFSGRALKGLDGKSIFIEL